MTNEFINTELSDEQLDDVIGGVTFNRANVRRDSGRGTHTKNPANGRIDSLRSNEKVR